MKKIEKENIERIERILPNFPDEYIITELSKTAYERKYKQMKLAFFPLCEKLENLNVKWNDELYIDFSDKNVKQIRKSLQPLDNDFFLVFCTYYNEEKKDILYRAIGIVSQYNLNENTENTYYIVNIEGFGSWDFSIVSHNPSHESHPIFRYKDDDYFSPEIMGDFYEKIKEMKNNWLESSERFKEFFEQILSKKCGTSFVIFEKSTDAEKEAKRLASKKPGRGILLDETFNLNVFKSGDFLNLLDIDGGLILDKCGKCYAYACIFDGIILKTFEGNRSRGARFNSMCNYIHYKNVKDKMECIGAVFSDDGGIDLVFFDKTIQTIKI